MKPVYSLVLCAGIVAGSASLAPALSQSTRPSAAQATPTPPFARPHVPAEPHGGYHILNATMGEMPPCSTTSNEPPKRDVVQVLRVVIPNHLNLSTLKRNVRYQSTKTDEEVEDTKNSGTKNKFPKYPNAPFSVDLREISTSGKYAQIRVVLRDHNYGFYSKGVWYADPNNKLGFCGANLVAKTHQSAIFYVKMYAIPNPPVDITGSFNIGLYAKAFPTTPFFIDPDIENNGFQ
jgi:hypothetical protein